MLFQVLIDEHIIKVEVIYVNILFIYVISNDRRNEQKGNIGEIRIM